MFVVVVVVVVVGVGCCGCCGCWLLLWLLWLLVVVVDVDLLWGYLDLLDIMRVCHCLICFHGPRFFLLVESIANTT